MSDSAHEATSDASATCTGNQPMTADALQEAKRYGREKLVCSLVDMTLDLVVLGVLAFVLARRIDARLALWPLLSHRWLRLGAMYLIVTGISAAISLPVSFYSGYVLERRFQLCRLTPRGWLWRWAKRQTLVIGLGLLLIEGLFWLIAVSGPYWWLLAGGAVFVLSALLGQLAPVLILPLFYKIQPLDDPELRDRFHRLSEGTGLSIQGVYRMEMSAETVKANAMLAGLGRTRRVILGDTLLSGFTPEEIDVVLAHEIGHHVFGHIPKLMLFALVATLASFTACDRALAAWVGGGFSYSAVPVSAVPLLLFLIALFSLLVEPLKNTLSRHFEQQCDRFALRKTADPAAFRSAFQKLAQQNKADPEPHWLEVCLFHDHPPITKRLALADKPAV